MTVKFLQSIASDVFSFRPGEIANIAEELAKKWEASGICEAVHTVPAKKDAKKTEGHHDVDVTSHAPGFNPVKKADVHTEEHHDDHQTAKKPEVKK